MKIIIDCFGADKGVREVVQGTLQAMEKKEDFLIHFVGPEKEIQDLIPEELAGRITITNSNTYIENTEEPTRALREKTDASMVIGLNQLLEEEYDGFLSCGSTGALMAGGTLIVKRIKNVKRPALMIVAPSVSQPFILMDVGANVDCTPQMLYQFGIMGASYAKGVLGMDKPSVGLLNIGTEEGKGDKLRKETYPLLQEASFNFVGNVEARDIYLGKVNVLITDGFTGNMILKTTEGVAGLLAKVAKDSIRNHAKSEKDLVLCKTVFGEMASIFDFGKYGSAPLIGLNKPVFKSHGSSSKEMIEGGILNLLSYIENKTNDEIRKLLTEEIS